MKKSLIISVMLLGLTTLSTAVFADPYTKANPAGGNRGIVYDTTNFATGTVDAVVAVPVNLLSTGAIVTGGAVKESVKVISLTPTTMVTQNPRYRAPLVQQIEWVAQ